jgi:hypothetical protein
MIAAAVNYRQAEKNTPSGLSTNPPTLLNSVYCQKAPRNSQLNGLVQAQDPANDPNSFFDPATGTIVTRGSQPNTSPFSTSSVNALDNISDIAADLTKVILLGDQTRLVARHSKNGTDNFSDDNGDKKGGGDKKHHGNHKGGDKKGGDKKDGDKKGGDKKGGDKKDGNEKDGNGKDGNKKGGDKKGGDKKGGDKKGGDKKDGDKKDGNGKDGNQKDGNQKERNKEDGNEKDGSKKDGSKKDGSKKDGSKKDGSKKDGSKKDGSKKDGSKKDGSKKDGSKKDGSKKDGDKKDGNKKDGGKKDGNEKGGDKKGGDKKNGDTNNGNKTHSGDPKSNLRIMNGTNENNRTNETMPAGNVGNFGSCSVPEIQFGAGFDGRRETSFEPTDKGNFFLCHCLKGVYIDLITVSFNHGSAQNIDIITQFMCDQLVNTCKADSTALSTCTRAKTAADGAPAKTGKQADAFNAVFGKVTNFAKVTALDDQGKPITARSLRRRTPGVMRGVWSYPEYA